MGKIIVTRDGVVEQQIQLSKERMAIGRRSRNDVVLSHPAVSGEHALITTILDESFLEDLQSTNGTFVNSQRVGKHILQHGDKIKVAKYLLEYQADGIRPLPAVQEAPVVAAPLPEGRIEVVNGANAGKQLALAKPLTTLGRPGVQVIVITRAADGYSIAHAEGAAAPLLNGQPLGAHPARLRSGDEIDLGGTKMVFRPGFA